MSTEQLLTVAEVAQRWRVSKMTVYRMCKDGVLRTVRVGRSIRIVTASVDQYESVQSLNREEAR